VAIVDSGKQICEDKFGQYARLFVYKVFALFDWNTTKQPCVLCIHDKCLVVSELFPHLALRLCRR
jgi:hypothetical protein